MKSPYSAEMMQEVTTLVRAEELRIAAVALARLLALGHQFSSLSRRQRRAIDDAVAFLGAVANRDQRHTWEQQTRELVAVIERVRAMLRGTYAAQEMRALQATLR